MNYPTLVPQKGFGTCVLEQAHAFLMSIWNTP